MGISLKTHKILWARSGGKCAICKRPLVVDPDNLCDDPSIVGDEAHIISRSKDFTRGDFESLSDAMRDHHSNLILLCKIDHKLIDDQPGKYTVELLREIKRCHEEGVSQHLTEEDRKKQWNDLIYSGYIEDWARRSKLDEWREISSYLSHDTPSFPSDWYKEQQNVISWLLTRIWSGQYPALEDAFTNYRLVLHDLIYEFEKHVDRKRSDETSVVTERFYKINGWDQRRYDKLLDDFEDHVALVLDLFYELTRAANYVCDRVREVLHAAYRMNEGALLVSRYNVGVGFVTTHFRAEYRGGERIHIPYPGLPAFKQVRFETRDYAIIPHGRSTPAED